jgi:hypothetical protein
VRFKGYMNKKLVGEKLAEFDYQPNKCGRKYRLGMKSWSKPRMRQAFTLRQAAHGAPQGLRG